MFNEEELILIKSCLLTAKETIRLFPFKKENLKNKIKEIDNTVNKINSFLN